MGFPNIYPMWRPLSAVLVLAPWRGSGLCIYRLPQSRYRSVSLIDRCTHRHSAVTPMTGSEVGGSLARLGGLPDPPGEGEERQDGLAAWGVQVGGSCPVAQCESRKL